MLPDLAGNVVFCGAKVRARTRPRTAGRRRFRLVQVLALLVALLVGCFILAKRVGAQPQPPKVGAGPAAAPKPAEKLADKKGAKGKDAGVDAALTPAEPVDAGADAGFDPDAGPLDYATVQTEEDFPKDLSDEQKEALGTGKVPIHRDGAFRSPFAHPRFGGPANVKVGLVIKEIREFNLQTGGFEADFFLSFMSDKDMPVVTPAFTNGHEVTTKTLADTPTFKLYSCSGKFATDVDLRVYPFDTQTLHIDVEDERAGVDQLVFEPNKARTSLDSTFRMASYSVAGIGAYAYKHHYPDRFDRDDLYVSRFSFTVEIERFAQSAAFSVFVPAFIIVIISLMGMWVPPGELEVRSNAGAPMLAAAVLFHYSLIQSLPATPYLTHADKLMLGVYISLLLNMASTWALLIVDEEGQQKVFTLARTWVPIATAVVMVLSVVL
jgi:hypothetical protein